MHGRVVRCLSGVGLAVAALVATILSKAPASVTASAFPDGSCAALLDNGGPPSEWAYWDQNGRLAYKTLDTLHDSFGTPYAGNGDRIMDFSYAGYMGGGVPFPNTPVRVTLAPVDSTDDDTPRIQAAIDQVGAMPADALGLRGAVLLTAGQYRLFGVLNLRVGGVVLRGAGSEMNGTVFDLGPTTHEAFNVDGTGSWTIGPSVSITDAYVPSGTRTFTVADVTGLIPGQRVLVTRTATAPWIEFMSMHDLMRNGAPQTWIGAGSSIRTDRTIVGISGNQVTLDAPLSDSMDAAYLTPPGGKLAPYTFPTRISQVGIEGFRVIGRPSPQGNKLLSMDAVTDSWVKDVYGQDLRSGLSVGDTAKRITLDGITLNHTYPDLNAAAPGDFGISGTQTLLVRCRSLNASGWFYALTQATDSGPIVVLDFQGSGGTAIQPHQRWATGMLTDRAQLSSGAVEYVNRGHLGSGHGWTMGWGVSWNSRARVNVQRPPGSMNWSIGSVGSIGSSTEYGSGQPMPHGIYESQGTHVSPSSLYLAQLCDRLGPQALANIGYSNPLPPPTATPTPTVPPTATPTPRPLPPGITPVTPLAGAVTASTHDGNVPGNTVDGSLDTRWSAQGDGQWIQYDLGASHVLAFLEIAAYSGHTRRSRFDIQVSNDGIAWSTVWVGESSGTTTAQEHYEIADVAARHVRLLGHENSANNWNSFTEVDFYATSGPPEPPTPTPRVTPRPTPPPDPVLGQNLALGKPSTASTNWSSSFNAPKAFDGSDSSRWSASANSATNQWLRVDLGVPTHFNCVRLKEINFVRVTSHVLQSSDDGASFKDIPGTLGTSVGPNKLVCFDTAHARYFRFFMHEARQAGALKEPTINEVGVYYQQRPPVVTVPADMVVEATGPDGATVTFEVSAMDDKDGPVPATADPPSGVIFPLGGTTVTASATDSDDNTGTATFEITVVDTTPPVITVPANIVAEATSAAGAPVSFTATAADLVDGNVPVVADFPSGTTFPLGRTVVTLTAADEAGNVATAAFFVDVADTTAPVIERIAADPAILWPPNHKMHTVNVAVQVAEVVDAAPTTGIVSVVSSEPDDGQGDGQTQGDWRITGDLSVELRAERSGAGSGRVYRITVESRDAAGNASTATVDVTVPHNP
jgi:hypothetical protein